MGPREHIYIGDRIVKYIGIESNGRIMGFPVRPKWNPPYPSHLGYEYGWDFREGSLYYDPWMSLGIPKGVLPPLEPCCLYRIDKNCYTLIEDRRKK